MQRGDDFITTNDRAFILKALKEELRIDGRNPYDFRKMKFNFSLDDSSCMLTLGTTRVLTAIAATLEAPFPDRPSEGSIRFSVELSPMASPAFEPGRPTEDAIELARLVERGLRQSNAIDQEALCVLAGRKVWALRVDTHVLDHGGNLVDACCLSALGALMAFRKPEVTIGGVSGTEVLVHPPEVKEPLPLTIHHLPISVTFGIFDDGETIVMDPSLKEEAAMQGRATIMVNPSKEVCAVHKAGGVGLSSSQLFRCVRLASAKADDLVAVLRAALEQHEVVRVQARVRRHRQGAAEVPSPVSFPAGDHMAVDVKLDEAARNLAAELGLDLSEEAGSSTSDDEDDEDASSDEAAGSEGGGGPGQSGGGEEGKAAAATLAARHSQTRGGPAKLTALPAVAGKPARTGAAAARPGKQLPKPKAGGSAKRAPEVKYDELEAIAAVIAGAGIKDEEVNDLSDAIKVAPKKKR